MKTTNALTGVSDLLTGGTPPSSAMRVSIDTDGKVFLCRIPELSLSASGSTAAEAYAKLTSQIAEIDGLLGEGGDPVAKVARLQRVEGLNRRLRKTSIVLLAVSLLFFALTITVVPLLDIRYAMTTAASNTLYSGIGKLAEAVTRMDPERKKKLAEDIGAIRQFVNDVAGEPKP